MKSKNTLWVARDYIGTLYLYNDIPERIDCSYEKGTFSSGYFYGYDQMQLDEDDFPEVTWENSPLQVTIIPTKEYEYLKSCADMIP